MKGVFLGVAIVAAVAGGVYVLRDSQQEPMPEAAKREASVTVTRRLAPDAVLSIKPGAPMKSAVVPAGATRVSPLLQEYYSGKGWKALYDRLRDAPARTTEAEIRDLLQRGADDPKARARLVEKEIAATMPPEGTPMMSSDGTSRLPAISDAQLEALKQAVQSGDPQALSIAGRVLASTMQNLVIRAGSGEQPVDIRAFYDAWSLAACDLGQPCGAESGRMLHSCATQGNCGAQDLREHLFFFDHSPQQSQRLAEYHAQIMQASRSGDWSYFTFHRGAPPRGWVSIFLAR